MYVATIVASNDLDENILSEIIANFPKQSKLQPITGKTSADIYFNEKNPIVRTSFVEELSIKYKVDIIIQEISKRTKKLLICDMESTIIENEFLDEIGGLIGIKQQVAMITERAMNGQINFEDALKERLDLIKDMPQIQITNLLKTRLKYNQGAKELVIACRQAGIYTMLVSGGFTIFTDYVAKELGFDESQANELIFENGMLKGLKEPILGKQAKLKLLEDKAKILEITLAETMAIGDGANDLPMLHAAGLGLAYKAKPKVREEIENQINHSNLMAAAYAAGVK